jgi:DNA-binding XRE family transcriptional regulator
MVKKSNTPIWPCPALIRAARGLVGIDQATLAGRAGVSRHAVMSLEGHEGEEMDYRRVEVLRKLQAALEKEFGIEFLHPGRAGMGVRFRSPDR